MDNTLISVIIPVYNGEQFVERAISSILNQTEKRIELIIVDDGSKDNQEESRIRTRSSMSIYMRFIRQTVEYLQLEMPELLQQKDGTFSFWMRMIISMLWRAKSW